MQPSKTAGLALLVFSQFAGTSLWFVGNAVADALPGAAAVGVAALTTAVQAGFIGGTLLFSLLSLADRIPAPRLFFVCALCASLANALLLFAARDSIAVLAWRFATGFLLAGIYPVGMKLAADQFPQSAGKALGFLVGALVLGTAFPHLVRSQGRIQNWQPVIAASSLLAVVGGLAVLVFFKRKTGEKKKGPAQMLSAFSLFKQKSFREAAFGYFGHMWELYALWAMLPALFSAYNHFHQTALPVSLCSFGVIAAGAAGCALGGLFSINSGNKPVAFFALAVSGICCVLAPALFAIKPVIFLGFMLVWGFAVAADSPQFSALVARAATGQNRGTALTLVTCIGFAITIVSIQLLQALFAQYKQTALWLLALGPLLGLLALKRPSQA